MQATLRWELPTLLREINKSENNNLKNPEAFIVRGFSYSSAEMILISYFVKNSHSRNKTPANLKQKTGDALLLLHFISTLPSVKVEENKFEITSSVILFCSWDEQNEGDIVSIKSTNLLHYWSHEGF